MNTDIKMAEFSVAAAPVGGRYNFAIIRELDMKIKEIGIRVPVTISPFSSTDEAIHLMWTHDVRHLLVVDREGLAGMVTDGDLIESVGMLTLEERRAVGHPVTTEEVIVADVMDAEVPCVAPDDLVTDAIHRMLYLRRPALPVVDGTQILGAISESDLLQLFAGSCWLDRGTPHAEPVINYGSHVLKTIAPDDRLEAACVKLSLGKIRHLLVVEGEQFVGMITDWDIRRAIGQHKVGEWLDLPVSQLMRTDIQTLRPKDSLACAADVMRMERLTALPITTRDGVLVSIITVSDLLQAFVGGATIHA